MAVVGYGIWKQKRQYWVGVPGLGAKGWSEVTKTQLLLCLLYFLDKRVGTCSTIAVSRRKRPFALAPRTSHY